MRERAWRMQGTAVVALMIVAAGCVQKVDDGPAKLDTREDPIVWRIDVTGGLRFQLNQRLPVRRVKLMDPRLPDTRWFGVEPVDWVAIGEGAKVKASVNVFPFDGDGEYVIPVTTQVGDAPPADPGAQSQALTNARLDYQVADKPESFRAFAIVEKPCRAVLREGGQSGELRCPSLSDGRASIAMVMTWG